MVNSLFVDIAVIFLAVGIASVFAKWIKQPFIPFYILAGILLVPVLHIVTNQDLITSISEFGIIFLLFLVGLEMEVGKLKSVSKVATMGGALLVALLFMIGFGGGFLFGFTLLEAVYLGLVFSFSSTMVTVKLLSDKNELHSLHGKIAIGLLIVQDVVAILAFIALTSYSSNIAISTLFFETIIILLVFFLLAKYVFPKLFSYAAESQELLFVLSITTCLLFAYMFGLISPHALGIGAFLAGLSLGNLPYNVEIISRISPLKDFFAVLFFISLGMFLPLNIIDFWLPALVFVALIFLIRPLIAFLIIKSFGYMPRVAFLTAMTQTEVSEFGLILVFFGISAGHLSQDVFGMVILMAILSIALTSYPFTYKNEIFNALGKWVKGTSSPSLEYLPKRKKKFVLLVGYDRLGYSTLEMVKEMNLSVVVVDFNPEIIESLVKQKIPCVYGDVEDTELLDRLDLGNARLIISTIPELRANTLLMKRVKEYNKNAPVFVTAETIRDALKLYEEGADYVLIPRYVGGKHLASLLDQARGRASSLKKYKEQHLEEIGERLQHARKDS